MRMFNRGALAAAALAVFVTAPASAQPYRWDIGLKGGYSWYTNSLDTDRQGLADANVRIGHGLLVGAQATHWAGGRLGIRANFDYQDRSIDSHASSATDERAVWNHLNVWTATGDLLFRFAQPNQTWMGAEVLPYLALGVGAKVINTASSPYTIAGGGVEGDPQQAAVFTGRTAAGAPVGPVLGMPNQTRLTGLVGLGADFRVAPGFAIRVEGFDRIFQPAIDQLIAQAPGTMPSAWMRVPEAQEPRSSRLTHELGLSLGLHLVAGLIPPPPVAVTPPPPPPAAPPPAPPPAAPREDRIMVCVIDPAAPGGIRMQEAFFRTEQRDTVMDVAGQRVALRTQIGDIPTAARADWYVRGEPLGLMVGTRRMEFHTYMTPRQIEANMLTYLGRVNGVPVYADRDQAQRFAPQLETARQARADHDLAAMLTANRVLRDAVADLGVLYVPMQPVGCVFQGLQPMDGVGKGK